MADRGTPPMEQQVSLEDFSLFGGPLHRLGERLRLAHGNRSAFALGLALGLLSWSILLALALVEGVAPKLFSLSVVAAHVRLLVVIPLFFLSESLLDFKIAGVCPPDRAFGRRAPERAAGAAIRDRAERPLERLLASGNNVPAGGGAVDRVRDTVSPVG